jgi:2-keto-4-pentenoate hydratase/2-oxohepta-3-ene-1,7-dioic acid hydratase in catechol pathway
VRIVAYQLRGATAPAGRLGLLYRGGVADPLRLLERLWGDASDLDAAVHFTSVGDFIAGGPAVREAAVSLLDRLDELLAAGESPALAESGTFVGRDAAILRPPLPHPGSLRVFSPPMAPGARWSAVDWLPAVARRPLAAAASAVGLWGEAGSVVGANGWGPLAPAYHRGSATQLGGPEAPVVCPPGVGTLRLEPAVGIVIGRGGVRLRPDAALECVAGFVAIAAYAAAGESLPTSFNRARDFDSSTALGPWVATPDEIPDPERLVLSVRVNEGRWLAGSPAAMPWGIAEVLAFVSERETLRPGDLIGLPLVPDPLRQPSVRPGDVVELEIDGLGGVTNTIVALPAARARR